MNAWYQQLGLTMEPVQILLLLGLTMGRSVPTLFFNPFLGGKLVSNRIKIATAAAFAVLLFPSMMAIPSPIVSGIDYFFLMLKEVIIGVTLGFITSVVFLGFGAAGRLVDMQRGANMAEGMVMQLSERASVFGAFYVQVAIVLFITMNGHHIFLQGYIRSFQILPVWEFPIIAGAGHPIVTDMMRLTANLFVIGLQLGAPAFVALFLTDVGMGIVNRASPQINVFNLSQPIKMGLGILMIVIAFRLIADQMFVWMGTMVELVFTTIGYLAK